MIHTVHFYLFNFFFQLCSHVIAVLPIVVSLVHIIKLSVTTRTYAHFLTQFVAFHCLPSPCTSKKSEVKNKKNNKKKKKKKVRSTASRVRTIPAS